MRQTYKLATWCPTSLTFCDGKQSHTSHEKAMEAARNAGPGKYRVSIVTGEKRQTGKHREDLKPFTI